MAQRTSLPIGSARVGLLHVFAFVGVLLLIMIVIVYAFSRFVPPLYIWLILLTLFIALTLVISHAYTQRWLGILIDERNKYSLSRLQMAMWTIIILSAFTAAVLANVQLQLLVSISGVVDPPQVWYFPVGSRVADALITVGLYDPRTGTISPEVDISQLNLAETLHDGQQIYVPRIGDLSAQAVAPLTPEEEVLASQPTTPLSVQIPSEVWILLGISTTSLVASPLIKGQKKEQIQANATSAEAQLSDFFRGEEGGNFLKLDLAKVQLFYFTVIVIGAYAVALASIFTRTQNAITSLPALDGGVVALLGVSHAGYLTNKAVPKSDGPSQPELDASATVLPHDEVTANQNEGGAG